VRRSVVSLRCRGSLREQSLGMVGLSARHRGSSRHRTARLTSPIPVRFPSDVLHAVKRRAEADDQSVASWIRRAVEHQLNPTA
jgi:hypothetical protein